MAKSERAKERETETETDMRRQILCVLVELRDEESGEPIFPLTAHCEQLSRRLFHALMAKRLLKSKHPAKAAMGWLSGGSGPGFAYLPVPGQQLV
jgi:hypothetical protein